MTTNTKHIDTVCSCNKLFNEKTLHPLISIIDFSKADEDEDIRLGCYSIMLLHHPINGCDYGKEKYDFNEGVLVFHSPDKAVDIHCKCCRPNEGYMLVFHPDLLCGTALGEKIKQYSFFKYKEKESLHISAREKTIFQRGLEEIEYELKWGVDRFTQILICNKLELFLNYCLRFYHRQFITRHDANDEAIHKITSAIDTYLKSEKTSDCKQPCPCQFAQKLNMSSAYFNDLLKHETGKDFNEYISLRRIDIAKQMILEGEINDKEIANRLGFCTAGRFRQLFIKVVGMTPEEYRG